MATEHYTYGEAFQSKILGLTVQNPAFLASYADTIKPEFFDRDAHTVVCRMILDYHRQHNLPPTKDALDTMVSEHCVKFKVPTEQAQGFLNLVYHVFTVDMADADFVRERAVKFGSRQAVKQGIVESINLVQKDEDVEKIREIMEKALRVGHNTDLGMSFFQEYQDLPRVVSESSAYNVSRKVPTLIPTLDQHLGGGLGSGELGSVMAPSGVGKSMALTNFGVAGLIDSKPVVHFTIGDLGETDVAIRYASRISGIPMGQLFQEMGPGDTFVSRIQSMLPGDRYLRIKYYPPGRVTVQTLRAYISRLCSAEQLMPGLIIVDYADKMKSSTAVGSSYEDLGTVYDELIGLARDYQCPVWTASQVQREAMREEVINIDRVSDSWMKINNADVVLSLNQTMEERGQGRVRIFAGKVRRGQDGFIIPCAFEKYRCYIYEHREEPAPVPTEEAQPAPVPAA